MTRQYIEDISGPQDSLLQAFKCLLGNDLASLQTILDRRDFDINEFFRKEFIKQDEGATEIKESLLHCAVRTNNLAAVEMLLAQPGILINQSDEEQNSALIIAAKEGLADILKILLKNPEINLEKTNNFGDTAFITAAFFYQIEVMKILLKDKRVNINDRLNSNNLVLYEVLSGEEVSVEEEIEEMPDENSVVYHAGKNEEMAKMLIKAGIEINGLNGANRDSVLHLAVKEELTEVVQSLLERSDLDLAVRNDHGSTALSLALGIAEIFGETEHLPAEKPDLRWAKLILLRMQYQAQNNGDLIREEINIVRQEALERLEMPEIETNMQNAITDLQSDEKFMQKMAIIRIVRQQNPEISFRTISQYFDFIEALIDNKKIEFHSFAERVENAKIPEVFYILKNSEVNLISGYDSAENREKYIADLQDKFFALGSRLEYLAIKTMFDNIESFEIFGFDQESKKMNEAGYGFFSQIDAFKTNPAKNDEPKFSHILGINPEEQEKLMQFWQKNKGFALEYQQQLAAAKEEENSPKSFKRKADGEDNEDAKKTRIEETDSPSSSILPMEKAPIKSSNQIG